MEPIEVSVPATRTVVAVFALLGGGVAMASPPPTPAPVADAPSEPGVAELLLFRRSAMMIAAASKQFVTPVAVAVNGVEIGSVGNRDCVYVRVPPGEVTIGHPRRGPTLTLTADANTRYDIVGAPRFGLLAPGIRWLSPAASDRTVSPSECRTERAVELTR